MLKQFVVLTQSLGTNWLSYTDNSTRKKSKITKTDNNLAKLPSLRKKGTRKPSLRSI